MITHLKVLIADEDKGARRTLATSLGPHAEVFQAEDGYEVLSLLEHGLQDKRPFNLVILDFELPHIDGFDVLTAVRALEEEHHIHGVEGVKVIVVSDLTDGEDLYGALSMDCEQLLLKPVDPRKVIRVLNDLKETTLDPSMLPH